ncbi:hypothetical protein K402DRAFT_416711 [Aulographum hederae CBS 113979]|uniref:Uncharacterized protein n=1 Tax=Aulographum hederae CBS 113979 TaxID=1176131 RepID=A0A6G1HEF3_9PEZI|nr:hypothetical protein K402DRAFT_416711 [Aulographum hederae CBS 113979]
MKEELFQSQKEQLAQMKEELNQSQRQQCALMKAEVIQSQEERMSEKFTATLLDSAKPRWEECILGRTEELAQRQEREFTRIEGQFAEMKNDFALIKEEFAQKVTDLTMMVVEELAKSETQEPTPRAK